MPNGICIGDFYAEWTNSNTVIDYDKVKNDLSLKITNISAETIVIGDDGSGVSIYTYLEFNFPFGDKSYHLMTKQQAKETECKIPLYWVKSFNQDTCTWQVKPEEYEELQTGDSIEFSFINLISDKNVYCMSCLNIDTKNNNAKGNLPIFMSPPPMMVKEFVCSKSNVGIMDTVDFSWNIIGSGIVVSDLLKYNPPGAYFLPWYGEFGESKIEPKGKSKCLITHSTNFSISVGSIDEKKYAFCPVYVYEPEIISLKSNCENNRTTFGKEVIISFELKNTMHCYFNHGIGRVEAQADNTLGHTVFKGSLVQKPTMVNNNYSVSCLGKDKIIMKNIEIIVTDCLEISSFSFYCKKSGDKYKYNLSWKIVNANSIKIYTSNKPSEVYQNSEKSISFTDSSDQVTVKIECNGSENQKINETRKSCLV